MTNNFMIFCVCDIEIKWAVVHNLSLSLTTVHHRPESGSALTKTKQSFDTYKICLCRPFLAFKGDAEQK